ncbi:MAG: hypothetical protein QUS14_16155 [Pyrinomonadaceae bacterium]|nr:hypothetical protein [Pyrinomonadaceae bacterium]
MKKVFWRIFAGVSAVVLVGVGAGYLYWKSFEDTPQYSLALLIDAARRDDQQAIDELVDTNAVVDSFVPQVTGKAADMYGRGLPPNVIDRMTNVAAPLMPAVKQKARAELPRLIRKETERFANVPFAGFVLGAEQYLEVLVEGETSRIRSKLPKHTFEVTMKRRGGRWQVIGVNDDALATRISQAIGQQIIGMAAKGDLRRAGESLGVENLQELIKQAEEAFEQ